MSADSPKVVSRFAPSPTGYLHVGSARTALFAWLLARHSGGQYLLRIEDTDLARSTQQAVDQLLEDLNWLGLQHDNETLVFQSKRTEIYNRIIDDLIARDLAYLAYETPEELSAMRQQAEREKRAFTYRRRKLSAEEMKRYEGRPSVVRFVMPVREWRFRDVVLEKDIVMPAEEAQDFVIRKTDGMPTYHFAVVVDDAEANVTHVVRGQEHLKNTFYHIALQEALKYPQPIYGHLPVIENMEGGKMSKRDRDKKIRERANLWLRNNSPEALCAACGLAPDRLAKWLKDSKTQLDLGEQQAVMKVIGLKESDLPEILVHDFRKNGYLPEALLNFLALLGWSPGGDRERMTMDEMTQLFTLDGIGKSSAKFDRTKLIAFNTEAAAAAAPDRLLKAFKDFLSVNPDSPLSKLDDETLLKILAMKKGFRTFREVDDASRFLFIPDDAIEYQPDAVEKILRKQNGFEVLRDLQPILTALPDWTAAAIEQAIHQYGEQKSLGLGKVAQPLRVAISGGTVSPPIFQSLEMLGKQQSLARIARCVAL